MISKTRLLEMGYLAEDEVRLLDEIRCMEQIEVSYPKTRLGAGVFCNSGTF